MKVILLEDVEKLGAVGSVVNVKNGFGMNYLLPRKLAVKATPAALKRIDRMKAEAVRSLEKKKRRAEELVNALNGVKLEFKVKAGEEGRLYGAITSRHIAEQLEKTAGMKLDHRKIVLEEPLKKLGAYEVPVASGAGTHATLIVEITEE